MDTIHQAELVVRQAGSDMLQTELTPRLYHAGWHVTINAEDGMRSLLAYKAAGRIYLPGGCGNQWDTHIAEIEQTAGEPADRRDLLATFVEVPVWWVTLNQSAPVDVILAVAERAAGGPGGVLATAA